MENYNLSQNGMSNREIRRMYTLDKDVILEKCSSKNAPKLCEKPTFWRGKILMDFGINIDKVGRSSNDYKDLYVQLVDFDRALQSEKRVLTVQYNHYKLLDVDEMVLYKTADFILINTPKDDELCKALTLSNFGPEVIQLKPNYATNFVALKDNDKPKIPTYCEQLASLMTLRMFIGEEIESALPVYLFVRNVRLDLLYYFLLHEKEQIYIIEEMAMQWNFNIFKYAIESLRKVGMDLIEIFNEYPEYVNKLRNFYDAGDIRAIDYFINQGYILTEEDKEYMNELQMKEPNKYGHIFDRYLY